MAAMASLKQMTCRVLISTDLVCPLLSRLKREHDNKPFRCVVTAAKLESRVSFRDATFPTFVGFPTFFSDFKLK